MNQPAFLADNAAARYRRHRPAYPKRLTDRVIALAGLAPGDAVLDLGAGPGFLALAFAQSGMNVTAADPDADMLAVADASARAADAAPARAATAPRIAKDVFAMSVSCRCAVVGGFDIYWLRDGT